MDFSVTLQPFLPLPFVLAAAAVALLAIILLVLAKGPAPVLRAAVLTLIVGALANPVLRQEDRDPLPAIAVIVSDESASQRIDNRDSASNEAREALVQRLDQIDNLEIRQSYVGDSADGTALFSGLERALADVPSDRIAGVFLISDGQIHDAETLGNRLGFDAPIHMLLSGRVGEKDRRIIIEKQQRFGIVDSDIPVVFRVEDLGVNRPGGRIGITISHDGTPVSSLQVVPGQQVTVPLSITHGGRNLFEIEAEPLEDELTDVNNRAVINIDGIRENLRVLLVSGAPHAGERTWRNILKSDAAVDLVHFTILRPPGKEDFTPINELALISFPTRELFVEKIDEFDLIIFDRYAQIRGLPPLFIGNITNYVKNGGAILIASGPEFAGELSLHYSKLADILPARPTGAVFEDGYRPSLSPDGEKHPITRSLEGTETARPAWGRWFRTVEVLPGEGRVLMQDENKNPVLITAEAGEGRVALMLSDQAWLWARGFEGGGPYVDLLRRIGHWLMREPSLEEEQLTARTQGNDIIIERRTMADTAADIRVGTPTGQATDLALEEVKDGLWQGRISNPTPGIWRFEEGGLAAIVDAGTINPREFNDPRSTDLVMRPIADKTGGGIHRIGQAGEIDLPRILSVRAGTKTSGDDWMAVLKSRATVLRSTSTWPVLGGFAGLLLLLGALSGMWYRERR